MTRAEIIEQYGDIGLFFAHYYKYSFTYTGTTEDGVKIIAVRGGCGDDIYKDDVVAGKAYPLRDLYPDRITVKNSEGATIAEVDDMY